jgi:acyl-CoA hydrolase/GNAT superfamily N-acetyltransferase
VFRKEPRWKKIYGSKLVSAEAAVAHIKNGDRIYVGSVCAEPKPLVRALGAGGLEDVEIIQLKPGEEASKLVEKGSRRFRLKTFYVGGRRDDPSGLPQSDQVPILHSEIPGFFRNRRIPVDTALIQVSKPDRFGQVSLGISVDISRSAVESARTVIAQVNPRMPRTLGNTFIPVEKIDYLVEGDEELTELADVACSEESMAISRYCGELIEDGSILQIGFAAISQGFIEHLTDRRDLGVHTEMFTDTLINLIEAGVVTNATKKAYRGKTLAAFCMGTRRLYDFVDNNPLFEFHPADVVLDPAFIAQNDKMVAMNIALQVDMRGQIRQGSLGWTAYEGSGGEQDFMRGASLSRGGRSIVCLKSVDQNGNSRIVADFGPRAAVITNRGDVHYVVTEFGSAYLSGKSIRERALALIEVAHPDHRESLMQQAREAGYVYPDQFYHRTVSPDLRERLRTDRVFKGGIKAHIRPIKSTDEAMLRDLFYHLSESSVYFRYFSPRRSMPHSNLQQYINLEADRGLSLVVTIGPKENRKMIAEARYVFDERDSFPELAFMVDEAYQGKGIGSFLLDYLVESAAEQGIEGFRLDVLTSNEPMMKLLEKLPYKTRTHVEGSVAITRFRFDELDPDGADA